MEPGWGVAEVVNAILSTNCKCIVTDGRRGGSPRPNHNLASGAHGRRWPVAGIQSESLVEPTVHCRLANPGSQ